jgi:hypothetical protein
VTSVGIVEAVPLNYIAAPVTSDHIASLTLDTIVASDTAASFVTHLVVLLT